MGTKEKQRKRKTVERVDEMNRILGGSVISAPHPTDIQHVLSFELPDIFRQLREDVTKPHKKKVALSRIRVQLNKPLTWAEVEDITHRGVEFKLTVAPNRQHVWAEGPMDSRRMYDIVAKVIADRYVNYFPMAVRTFSEYTRPERS